MVVSTSNFVLTHLEPGMWVSVVIRLDPLPMYGLLQTDMGTLSDFLAATGPVIHGRHVRGFPRPWKQVENRSITTKIIL